AILFFHINDESKIKNLLLRENIANNLIETNFQRVEHIISMFTEASDYAYSTICRRKKIYDYFDETPDTCADIDVFDCEDNCGVCFYVKKYDMYLCANCDNCASYLGGIRGGGTDAASLLKKDSRNGVAATLPRSNVPHAVPIDQGIDLSAELKTLLSCISSLRGRTGVGVICKVLVKSKEACIVKKGYHNIKEYGDGAHKSTSWWSAFLKVARNDKYVKETLVYSKDVSYLSVGVTPKGEAFIKADGQRYTVKLPFFLIDKEKKPKSGKGAKKANGFKSANGFGSANGFKSANEPSGHLYDERASQRNRGSSFGTGFTHRERKDYLRRDEKQLEGEPLSPVLSTTHRSVSHQAEGVYPITQASVERNNAIPENKYQYFNTDKNQCHREHQYKEEKLTEEKINDSIMKILLRTRIIEARQQNIPPFQLISDKPLKDICHKRLTSVHLIRKHVDNISPVCPNSFLEKLISGIRGFCLLHDLDTNINLNTASQNVGSAEPIDRGISSLNKFSNLISSFQYDNKRERLGGDSSLQRAPSREIRSGPYAGGGMGSSLAHSGVTHGGVVHSGVTHGGVTHGGASHSGVSRHYAPREEETPSFQSRHFKGGPKTDMKIGVSDSCTSYPRGERNHPSGHLIGGAKPLLEFETNRPQSDLIEKRSAKETTLSPFCTTSEATNQLHLFSGDDKNRLMDFFEDDFKFVKEPNKWGGSQLEGNQLGGNQLGGNQLRGNQLEANPNGSLLDSRRARQAPIGLSNYTFQDDMWRGGNAAQPMQIAHGAAKPNEGMIPSNRIDAITHLSTPREYANGGARTGPSAWESPPGDPCMESFRIRKTTGENHVDVLNDKKKKFDLIDSFSYDYKKKQDEDNLGMLPGGHGGVSSFQDLKRRRF
ncbi:ATP dependent RNA helicase, partial [Plasmodium cynomolgi strain B]